MKAIYSISIAAALLSLASCAGKADKAAESEEVKVEETACRDENAGQVIELTDPAILAPGTEVQCLTVVDFNAVWCGPCRRLAPVLHQMAQKYAGKAVFYSVDVDRYGELMDQYDLGQSIPVVLFLRPDGTATHYVGTSELLPADKFEALINENL